MILLYKLRVELTQEAVRISGDSFPARRHSWSEVFNKRNRVGHLFSPYFPVHLMQDAEWEVFCGGDCCWCLGQFWYSTPKLEMLRVINELITSVEMKFRACFSQEERRCLSAVSHNGKSFWNNVEHLMWLDEDWCRHVEKEYSDFRIGNEILGIWVKECCVLGSPT